MASLLPKHLKTIIAIMQLYISKLLLIHLLQSTLLGKLFQGCIAHGNASVFYIKCFLHLSLIGGEEQGQHLVDNSNRCLCPGDSLTFECTVIGESGGSTVWRGSVFNCIGREIALFHAEFESIEGAYGECGDIVAMGQSVRSDVNTTNGNSAIVSHYTSRLTVPSNSDRVGRTIECYYDDGATATLVERETVNITIGIKNTMDNNINNNNY